jgi:hypothetical protein
MTKKCLITDKITDICVANILAGMPYSACARAVRIAPQTWCNWVNLGKEGKAPYAKWYIAIQEAESSLLKECLESVKLSMKQGNVETSKWMLERRFGADGYGKASTVNMNAKTESVNVNLNANATTEEREKIRAGILEKLQPRNRIMLPGSEEN